MHYNDNKRLRKGLDHWEEEIRQWKEDLKWGQKKKDEGQLYTNYTKDNKSTSASGRRKSSKEQMCPKIG